jgi:PAS domain S-box-containing protein
MSEFSTHSHTHDIAHSIQADSAFTVINTIPAMIGYWDLNEKCRFANDAFCHWLHKNLTEMSGLSLKELFGPLYQQNEPYIHGALAGAPQVFEQKIPFSDGTTRDTIATFTPDVNQGVVRGISVHITDVSRLRQRELALADALRQTINSLEKTKSSFRSKELKELRLQLQAALLRMEGS